MNKSDWQKLNEILNVAVELEGTGQKSFLEKSCAGDAQLRCEAEEMLAAARQAAENDFLAGDAFAIGSDVLIDREKIEGKRIGKYRIVREIGRGGMGAVYLAEREDFRQQVALKIIKRGMDTDEIIRHFQREREVLAALNHPNIARLLDGGTTTDGLPFFVMEYVEGKSVTEFCDEKKLNIESRLTLFRKICEAVSFAHQNLIVHRDIKPSNILITAGGEPKLLDFGIAKLLKDGENTLEIITQAGLRMMTPEYASPEQITGERVTTSSDIYSLGVLLYELLCGHRPFHLKNRTSPDIVKIISEQKPPAPSTAALSTEEVVEGKDTRRLISPVTVADLRGEKPSRLQKKLSGDLDNIVLTALRKEPARRYATVEQFSEDLQRHLAGLPVTARRNTFGYTTAKFIRRNRAAVTFTGIAVFAVLAALSIALWQAVEARNQRSKAERRFTEVRKLANRLMTDVRKEIESLQQSNNAQAKLAAVSSEYLSNLAQEADEPELLKELALAFVEVGHNYAWQLKNTDEARMNLNRAVETARRALLLAPNDADAKHTLAWSLEKYNEFFGRENHDLLLQYSLERLDLREEILTAQPDESKSYREASNAFWSHGYILNLLDRPDEAKNYFLRAAKVRERQIEFLQSSADTFDERVSLSGAYLTIGIFQTRDLDEKTAGIVNLRHAVSIAETAFAEQPANKLAAMQIIESQLSLGHALKQTRNFSGALEVYRNGLNFAREFEMPASDIPWKLDRETAFLINSAICLFETGAEAEAMTNVRQALHQRREFVGNQKNAPRALWGLGATLFYGGKSLAAMGKFDEALAAFREAESEQNKFLAGEPDKTKFRSEFANLYIALGDLYSDCKPDNSHPDIYPNYRAGAACIISKDIKRLEEARRWYEKTINALAPFEKNALKPEDVKNLSNARDKISFINSFFITKN